MSNSQVINDKFIYDYNGVPIYPYTNISSIKLDGYKSSETPSLYDFPVQQYITDCVKEYNKDKYVDTLSNQLNINGDKTFNGTISFINTVSGKITHAIGDEYGNNIYNSFIEVNNKITDISDKLNNIEIPTEVNLADYSGEVKLDVSNTEKPAKIIGSLDITDNATTISISPKEIALPCGHILSDGDDASDMYIQSKNELNIGCENELYFNSGSTVIQSGYINVYSDNVMITGNVNANGFYETSDERLKTFRQPIPIDLDKLSQLRKSYYIFNEHPTSEHIGVSAQEIQKLYPEIVTEGDYGVLRVDYSKLSVIALAAIDVLYKENIELKNRLDLIESKLK